VIGVQLSGTERDRKIGDKKMESRGCFFVRHCPARTISVFSVCSCSRFVSGQLFVSQTENASLEWPQKTQKSTKTAAHMLERMRFEFLWFFVFFVAIYSAWHSLCFQFEFVSKIVLVVVLVLEKERESVISVQVSVFGSGSWQKDVGQKDGRAAVFFCRTFFCLSPFNVGCSMFAAQRTLGHGDLVIGHSLRGIRARVVRGEWSAWRSSGAPHARGRGRRFWESNDSLKCA